jgi:hypothetical protein
MMDTTCKIYKRVGNGDIYEPYASSVKDMNRKIEMSNHAEAFCRCCGSVVDVDGQLDRAGIYSACPFDGHPLNN